MNYQVKTTSEFERSLKKIAKKHPSIRQDFLDLIAKLKTSPKHGTSLGHNLYKIRLKVLVLVKVKEVEPE